MVLERGKRQCADKTLALNANPLISLGSQFTAGSMSKAGVDFMHEWVDTHITSGCRPFCAATLDALAGKCARDAAKRGIALVEIEGELEADLRGVIFDALVNDPQDEFDAFVRGRQH